MTDPQLIFDAQQAIKKWAESRELREIGPFVHYKAISVPVIHAEARDGNNNRFVIVATVYTEGRRFIQIELFEDTCDDDGIKF